MKIVARILAALVGITGLIQIAIGILFWTGHALPLIPLHMTMGIVFVAAMWILGGLGFRAHLAMRSSIVLVRVDKRRRARTLHRPEVVVDVVNDCVYEDDEDCRPNEIAPPII